MLFIFACILLITAVILLGKFIYSMRQPRVKAIIVEVIEEENNWWSKTSSKIVTVSYDYNAERHEKKKTYLIAQKAEPGQIIILSINPKKSSDFKPFYPKLELLAVILLFAIGFGLLWFCIWMIDWLE